MPVPVVVLDEEGVPVAGWVLEFVVLRVANGLADKVVVGVTRADPETVSVAEGVANGDAVPEPVLDCEAVVEGVPEAVQEGLTKAEGVCVTEGDSDPVLDLV